MMPKDIYKHISEMMFDKVYADLDISRSPYEERGNIQTFAQFLFDSLLMKHGIH